MSFNCLFTNTTIYFHNNIAQAPPCGERDIQCLFSNIAQNRSRCQVHQGLLATNPNNIIYLTKDRHNKQTLTTEKNNQLQTIGLLSHARFGGLFVSDKMPNNAVISQSLIALIVLATSLTRKRNTIDTFDATALFGIFYETNLKLSRELGSLSMRKTCNFRQENKSK